jgi:hypothetical protein
VRERQGKSEQERARERERERERARESEREREGGRGETGREEKMRITGDGNASFYVCKELLLLQVGEWLVEGGKGGGERERDGGREGAGQNLREGKRATPVAGIPYCLHNVCKSWKLLDCRRAKVKSGSRSSTLSSSHNSCLGFRV